jgi:release factor glutamine methyltransferase
MNNQLKQIITRASHTLIPLYAEYNHAEEVVWWMVCALTRKTKLDLIVADASLTPQQELILANWIHEHSVKHKPLAYLLGSVPFNGCTILVEPPVLIPRPETEEWVHELIQKLCLLKNTQLKILDLCTGSGAIACALARALPEATITAVDISEHALQCAKKNAELNTVNIQLIHSDLFSSLRGQTFDLIVTNPPYISAEAWHMLDASVKDWEDYNALVAPEQGLKLIRLIIEQAPLYLRINQEMISHSIPALVCEIGYDQGEIVRNLMNGSLKNGQILFDYCGKARVVTGFLR